MNVALIQSDIIWESPQENRNHFEQQINAISQPLDLVVLPEMFTTGFSMNPKPIAETMNGKTVLWMKKIVSKKNCAIVGSIVIRENNNFYNRMIFVYPNQEIAFYDKKHLFKLAGEDKNYTAGTQKKMIDFMGFKICLLICYDLRFPSFSYNYENYDLLIYVANWPITRINAWNFLLKARAVENMSFVIGVNRIGNDENQNQYNGQSQIIDFLGDNIVYPNHEEGVFVAKLSKIEMAKTRKKLGFLNDGKL
jgi:omega-amidase